MVKNRVFLFRFFSKCFKQKQLHCQKGPYLDIKPRQFFQQQRAVILKLHSDNFFKFIAYSIQTDMTWIFMSQKLKTNCIIYGQNERRKGGELKITRLDEPFYQSYNWIQFMVPKQRCPAQQSAMSFHLNYTFSVL